MFQNCTCLNQPLNNWDVSNITNMSYMFHNCKKFNEPLDKWNVNDTTNMSFMFYNCKRFNKPLKHKWKIIERCGSVRDRCPLG